jgi:integrase
VKGHVRERPPGSGNWYAVIGMRDPATGKRKLKWHSLPGCDGKRKAQIACARLISAMQSGTYQEPSKVTVAVFLDRWLEHMKPQVSRGTHETYTEIVRKRLVPLLGGVVLTQLQPMQVSEAYAKALANGRRNGSGGLSARTVQSMHRTLKQAIAQAVRWQMLTRNPLDAVAPPKVERRRRDTYDMTQTAELLDAMRHTRMHVPVLLAALCGLRRGEIAALRWRCVDFERSQLAIVETAEQVAGVVRLKQPKSGRARTVAMSATVAAELRAHRVRQAQEQLQLGVRLTDDSLVVAQVDGTPLQPTSLTHGWYRALANTALPRYRFHDLRHAHATHLLASGVHPKVASERLGHSTVGITLDLYSHVLPGMQADAAARVDQALQAARTERGRKIG